MARRGACAGGGLLLFGGVGAFWGYFYLLMEGPAKLLSVIIAGVVADKTVKIFTRVYELSDFGFFDKGGVKDAFKFIVR